MIDVDAPICFRSRWLVRATEAGSVQPPRNWFRKVSRNCDTESMAKPQEKQAITQSMEFYPKPLLSYYLHSCLFPADVAG
jgi:hypothetical protein